MTDRGTHTVQKQLDDLKAELSEKFLAHNFLPDEKYARYCPPGKSCQQQNTPQAALALWFQESTKELAILTKNLSELVYNDPLLIEKAKRFVSHGGGRLYILVEGSKFDGWAASQPLLKGLPQFWGSRVFVKHLAPGTDLAWRHNFQIGDRTRIRYEEDRDDEKFGAELCDLSLFRQGHPGHHKDVFNQKRKLVNEQVEFFADLWASGVDDSLNIPELVAMRSVLDPRGGGRRLTTGHIPGFSYYPTLGHASSYEGLAEEVADIFNSQFNRKGIHYKVCEDGTDGAILLQCIDRGTKAI